jgi:hypothetical protein
LAPDGTGKAVARFSFRRQPEGGTMPQIEGDHIHDGDHLVGTGNEARAGVTGHNARYVLIWSTLGCAVLFVAVYLYFFMS